MYTVQFTKEAKLFLKKQGSKTTMRLVDKINELAKDPYAPNNNVTKLAGREGYRLRVGDIRVLYEIHDRVLIINVFKIGFRSSIYKEHQ